MKIILLTKNKNFLNHNNIFGTENIVKIISDEMNKIGIEAQILGCNDNQKIVIKNPINYFSRGRLADTSNFKEILKENKPDLVQFHGFSAGEWGLSHLLACKEFKIKTLLWHNVPSITCMQHELLYMSRKPCDGKFSVQKCTSCRLNYKIKNEFISNFFGTIGNFPIEFLNYKKSNRLLSSRKYSYEFYNSIKIMKDNFDVVRIGSDWVKRVLLKNDFDEDKLAFIRPSVSKEFWDLYNNSYTYPSEDEHSYKGKNINLLFWGRLVRSKGINVIRKSIKLLNKYKYTIHIVGDVSKGDKSFKKLYSENKKNEKIIFHGSLDHNSIFKLGIKCDLALIPSSWFETGPITVYEAFAMNLPIIGTKLGGIEEICTHNINSLLFELNNHKELANLIINLINEPSKINYLRSNIPKPRSPQDLGIELRKVYEKFL